MLKKPLTLLSLILIAVLVLTACGPTEEVTPAAEEPAVEEPAV